MYISSAAFAAFCCNKRLSVLCKVLHHSTACFVDNNSTHRHFNNQIFTCLTKTLLFHSVLSGFSFIFSLIFKIHKGSQVSVSLKYNISSLTAVTAVRSSLRHKRFPSECHGTVSAFSGFYHYFGSVYKHKSTSSVWYKKTLYHIVYTGS